MRNGRSPPACLTDVSLQRDGPSGAPFSTVPLAGTRLLGAQAAVLSVTNSGATISHIINTSGNQSEFMVTVLGGTAPCADASIQFPQSAAPDAATLKRAYARPAPQPRSSMYSCERQMARQPVEPRVRYVPLAPS